MSKYNLVWLILISFILLLLQVHEACTTETAVSRYQEESSATLEDGDVGRRVHRRKREPPTPSPSPDATTTFNDYFYEEHESLKNNDDDMYDYVDEDPVLEKVAKVPLGKFPFMVAVERLDMGEPVLCAGSIFTNQLVIIGASCAGSTERERDPSRYTIIAGVNNLSSSSLKYCQKRNVTEIIFDETSKPSIALLRLDVPLRFNDNVKERRISFERFVGWRACSVIQWGNINKTSTNSWTLLKLDMQIYDMAKCRQKSDTVEDADLKRGICAFSLGQNKNPVCRGGGTVLYCDNVITGFRKHRDARCAIVKQVAVYTDLGAFAMWTRDYAPKTIYNKLPLGIRSLETAATLNNHSSNIDAIVFLSLSSALALFILH